MSTTFLSSLGSITGAGLLTQSAAGVFSAVTSNPSASALTNYFVKDFGGGVFTSTALPTALSIPTVVVTTASQQAASNTQYLMQDVSAISTLTLPASPAVGDVVSVKGGGVSGATFNHNVALNATQSYSYAAGTPTGTGTTLTSTQPGSQITFTAGSAGTSAVWMVTVQVGSYT